VTSTCSHYSAARTRANARANDGERELLTTDLALQGGTHDAFTRTAVDNGKAAPEGQSRERSGFTLDPHARSPGQQQGDGRFRPFVQAQRHAELLTMLHGQGHHSVKIPYREHNDDLGILTEA
jgi:hypothetical protein